MNQYRYLAFGWGREVASIAILTTFLESNVFAHLDAETMRYTGIHAHTHTHTRSYIKTTGCRVSYIMNIERKSNQNRYHCHRHHHTAARL